MVAEKFSIAKDGTHMSVISMAETAELEIKFNEKHDLAGFNSAVGGIRARNGPSSIQRALEKADAEMFSRAKGMRGTEIHKVLVIIFDGVEPTAAEIAIAKRLRDDGIKIFAFGVGQSVTTDQLEEIGTTW